MSLGTSNRDGGKTSESGHLRALAKIVTGDIITGLNAVQRAAGVNMSVDVQIGDAFVRRSDGSYAHPVFNDAVYNQVISAADGSNPRRDIVVIYVDYGQAPSTAVSNNTNGVVKIKVVNGTPAGSPTDPSGATIQSSVGAGNPYSILARVRVPAGQTSISDSLIDDLRTLITSNAGTVNAAALAVNAATGNDGWISTSDVWTYASASTFTIPGDKTAIYSKGTRLKFTQTTVKYGVVLSSSYSAPNTTVTIAVNTSYVLANAAISANYYSYSINPQGYPTKFAYTCTVTAPGGTAPTYASAACYFSITGGVVSASVALVNTTGGTAGAGAVVLLLSKPVVQLISSTLGVYKAYEESGTTFTGLISDNDATTCYLSKYDMIANILAQDQSSANRYIQASFSYLI